MKSLRQWITPLPPECDAPTKRASGSNNPGNHRKPPSTEPPSALTEAHVRLLWERMAKIYGHKWVGSFGAADDGTWLSGLRDVTPSQIGIGLERCRTRSEPWPPTLPEFRALCKSARAPYHRPFPRPPKPPANPEIVSRELNKMKQLLRKSHA